MAYQKPCVAIHSVLGHYAKISGEHLPYSFYRSNKTTALAYSMPIDRPLVSVKLHGKNGSKDLYMVREKVQVQIVLTFFLSLTSGFKQYNPLIQICISPSTYGRMINPLQVFLGKKENCNYLSLKSGSWTKTKLDQLRSQHHLLTGMVYPDV